MRLTGFFRDVLSCRGVAGHGGGVCVVRPDGIGDYILFRPFLPLVRAMFPGMRLTLCANAVWVALSMRHDAGLVDDWVAVDRGRLKTDRDYAAHLFAKLRAEGFDVALNPLHSRDYISDILTFATRAARRETPQGDLTNQPRLQWMVTGMLYTARHTSLSSDHFEMYRTHAFLEGVAGGPLAFPPVAWPADDATTAAARPFVVFSLGASVPEKRWPATHHAEVAAWVLEHAGLDVVLCGGGDVRGLADDIMARLAVRLPQPPANGRGSGDAQEGGDVLESVVGQESAVRRGLADVQEGGVGRGVTDMQEGGVRRGPTVGQESTGSPSVVDAVGTVPLTDLPALLRQAAAVVTHDSAVYHLALACGRPTVCIADGRGWRRFTPWPADLPGLASQADQNGSPEQEALRTRNAKGEDRAQGVAGQHPADAMKGVTPPHAGRAVCLNADGALHPIGKVAPAQVIEMLEGLLRRCPQHTR